MSSSTSKSNKFGRKKNTSAPFAAETDVFPLKNIQQLALEPILDAEKAKIWKSHVIVPYSIADITYIFLGPYPNPSVDHEKFKGFFS